MTDRPTARPPHRPPWGACDAPDAGTTPGPLTGTRLRRRLRAAVTCAVTGALTLTLVAAAAVTGAAEVAAQDGPRRAGARAAVGPVTTGARTSAAVTAAAVTAPGTTSTPGRPAGRLVPDTGVLFGLYTSTGSWGGTSAAMKHVASRESLLGRKVAINQHYYAWRDAIPSGMEQADLAAGRIPLVTWEPTEGLDVINSGASDVLIRTRAKQIAALGQPVMIRFGHEMNGNWYSWGGDQTGFVNAWRRVHRIFAEQGTTNAVWVWSPNWISVPTPASNSFTYYYPGDQYVDWVAVDAYNWGSQRSGGWTALAPLLRPVYDTYAARKPIMVAETASTEQGGDKAAWVAQTAQALRTDFPAVAALVWFDQKNADVDWRIDTSASALTAVRALGSNPWFTARVPVSAPVMVPEKAITVTNEPDRSGAVPLAGRTVSGKVFVRATPTSGVDSVTFHLDDTARARTAYRTDTVAPYDLVDGTATNALDTAGLSAGTHTLTVATTTAGWVQTRTVSFTVAKPTAVPVDKVRFSLKANRSDSLMLDGKTVSGRVHVTAYPVTGSVTRVAFWLDDPQRTGAPVGDEYGAPWDLKGGSATAAVPWDVSGLAKGRHVLTVATTVSGRTELTHALFTVG